MLAILPAEIARRICEGVAKKDLACLRLTSRFLNNVATLHLFSTLTLYFTKVSFERLIAISKCPIISEYVKEIIYIPNTLDDETSRKVWESSVPVYGDGPRNLKGPPSPSATEREWRVWRRDVKRSLDPPNPYTRKEMDVAWEVYKRMLLEQDELRASGYGLRQFTEALARFPRLVDVRMNHGWALWPGAWGLWGVERVNPFDAALANGGGDHLHEHPSGVYQFCSLIAALHRAGCQLQCLHAGDVNWKFLQQDEATIQKIKDVLKMVRDLTLVISLGYTENEIGVEIPECRRWIYENDKNKDKLYDLLTSAPDLTNLDFTLDWNVPYAPIEFKDIVQSYTWPSLRVLYLDNIDAADQDWIAFFERHSPTLKHLSFRSIKLLTGGWPEALEHMQKCLTLESACVGEELVSAEYPHKRWLLEPHPHSSRRDVDSQGNRTRMAIESFLVERAPDTCPLRDRNLHPPFDDEDDENIGTSLFE